MGRSTRLASKACQKIVENTDFSRFKGSKRELSLPISEHFSPLKRWLSASQEAPYSLNKMLESLQDLHRDLDAMLTDEQPSHAAFLWVADLYAHPSSSHHFRRWMAQYRHAPAAIQKLFKPFTQPLLASWIAEAKKILNDTIKKSSFFLH